MNPFTQVKSAEHMAKFNKKSISNWGTFCNFSLTPKRKNYKTSMKHLKIHKFLFKNVTVLATGLQNVPENSAKTSLPWLHFKTDHALRREENKVEFLEDDFLIKSFPSSTKRKLSILQLSLSIFCLLTVYF